MCVFLLKMREYYRWEKQIPLSHPLPRNEIGDWLTEREEYWEQLQEQDFSPLHINNQELDPFDSDQINQFLNPMGYVYSGGLGFFQMKNMRVPWLRRPPCYWGRRFSFVKKVYEELSGNASMSGV